MLNERDPRHPKAGGAEIHIAEIFGRLAASGFEISQLASGFAAAPDREQVGGMQVRRLGPLGVYYPRAVWQCARRTRSGDFDVVVECLNKLPYYSPLYSRVPVLALCHHLFGEVAFQQVSWPIAAAVWTAERGIPWAYRRCSFITISESSRQDLVARGIPSAQIQVSLPGVQPCRAPVDTSAARPARIACLGRLEPYKRVDRVLRAVSLLRERFPSIELIVVGRGSARASLEALAAELGLSERVRFTGFVSDEERDALLTGCRLAVCASPKEGWGLTVVESNSAGTPVVATDAPGLRDSVQDGRTGLLLEEASPEAFAEAIARLLQDDALAVRMSREALAWSKRFDWDRAADEMAEAIERAIRAPD